MDLSEPLALIESLTTRLDDNVDGLSNDIGALSNNLVGMEEDVGALETWRAVTDPKIRALQEFDVVFYNDLQNLHGEIDDVAENASNARAALSNELSGRIEALSINLVGLEEDVSALSNTLAYDYITTRDLNDQLVATYIQSYEKLNFSVVDLNVSGVERIGESNIFDLIDEAMSDPYILPNDISWPWRKLRASGSRNTSTCKAAFIPTEFYTR